MNNDLLSLARISRRFGFSVETEKCANTPLRLADARHFPP
jgi:hypothetical protein